MIRSFSEGLCLIFHLWTYVHVITQLQANQLFFQMFEIVQLLLKA